MSTEERPSIIEGGIIGFRLLTDPEPKFRPWFVQEDVFYNDDKNHAFLYRISSQPPNDNQTHKQVIPKRYSNFTGLHKESWVVCDEAFLLEYDIRQSFVHFGHVTVPIYNAVVGRIESCKPVSQKFLELSGVEFEYSVD